MAWRRLADWKTLAVLVQLAVALGCIGLGWRLVHGHPAIQPAAKVQGASAAAPFPALAAVPRLPALGASAAAPANRPGLTDILQRINRDDTGLYRGQWATIQLLAGGTRDYMERHIVPLLLAAARGGRR